MLANKCGLLAVALIAVAPQALTQLEVGGSAVDNCSQIDAAIKTGDYARARERAQACVQELDQKLAGEVGKYFLPEVAGWKRTSLDQDAMLGFTNVSANYQKGDHTANVSLTGGAGGSGLGSLLGGIARLGLQAGQQVRVAGLPASVQPDGTITVTLSDGSFLTFMSSDFDDQTSALEGLGDLVNAFPVADINKMLQ